MNSKFIQSAVQKFLYDRNNHFQCCNYQKTGYHEADILGVTLSHLVTEVEIKVSIADYKADFKKTHKHYLLENRITHTHTKIPNRFYYACPDKLIKEVPDYAGLLWVDENESVMIVKPAPMLHKLKADEKLIIGMLSNLTAKTIWGCQKMTYDNRKKNGMD